MFRGVQVAKSGLKMMAKTATSRSSATAVNMVVLRSLATSVIQSTSVKTNSSAFSGISRRNFCKSFFLVAIY